MNKVAFNMQVLQGKMKSVIFPSKSLLLLLCSLSLTQTLSAQSPYSAGGESAALGGVTLLPENVWAVHNDPAAMAGLKGLQAGLWAERRYNLAPLTNGAVCLAIPTGKVGVFGFGIYQYGGSTYFKQQKYSLCYALALSSDLYAGIGLHTLNTHIDIYGNELAEIGEISVLYKLNSTLKMAASVWNVNSVKLATYQEERIPMVYRLGAEYKVSENVQILSEIEKDLYGQKNTTAISPQPSFKIGIHFQPEKNLEAQIGVRSNPGAVVNAFVYSCGLGFRYQQVKINLAFAFYEILGSTPNMAFEYFHNEQK